MTLAKVVDRSTLQALAVPLTSKPGILTKMNVSVFSYVLLIQDWTLDCLIWVPV